MDWQAVNCCRATESLRVVVPHGDEEPVRVLVVFTGLVVALPSASDTEPEGHP
jgi:hypothetical protein